MPGRFFIYPLSMNDIPKLKKRLSEAGLLYAAAIWGSTFFIVKDSLNLVDPVILVGYRFTLAAILLGGYCLIAKKQLLVGWGKGIILGIFLWLLYIPQTIGLSITTASNSGFITGLFVAFVPIFSLLIFKRKPSTLSLIATVISLAGLWTLTGGMTDINNGDLLTLLAAMTYAIHILYVDKYLKQGYDPAVLCFQQFLFVGLVSLIVGAIFKLPFTPGNLKTITVILFLTLFPTLSAFAIQMVAQKFTSPLRVSLIFALEPVFAAVFAWTLGNEQVIMRRALGGLLIFAAMLISSIPAERFKFKRKRF